MINNGISSIRVIPKGLNGLLLFLSVLLLFNCIFDPAGLLFGIKDYLFIILVVVYFCSKVIYVNVSIDSRLLYFILFFGLLIPSLSLFFYFIFQYSNGVEIDYGIFKTFLFLLFALIICDIRRNIVSAFSILLSLLSITIIIIFIITTISPEITSLLNAFGIKYQIGKIVLNYMGGFKNVRIYFWTSPMIIFACVHYYTNYLFSKKNNKRYLLLMITNMIGLFLSGSRLNMGMSILFIPLVSFYYANLKNKIRIVVISSLVISLFILINYSFLTEYVFSKDDTSNAVKFSLVNDYYDIYSSNVPTFLFGQGVGSYFYQSRGMYLTYSELTYFEILRRFGFILGIVYCILMFVPALRLNKSYDSHIVVAYLLYALMSFFNPFFFSSSGIIIFSIVLSTIYNKKYDSNSIS